MPKVLEVNGFIFFFYSQEGNEPEHIHVRKGGNEAKFWLTPIKLQENHGFSPAQMRFIKKTIAEHQQLLLTAWDEFFNG
ncbi:MAG TPA: DUF4160 domain-containing protein [Candidatus Kapabacteria bacterium]|nr:DUF4160 domain-containing protein [Candidatus Kapabacteria bacterium]